MRAQILAAVRQMGDGAQEGFAHALVRAITGEGASVYYSALEGDPYGEWHAPAVVMALLEVTDDQVREAFAAIGGEIVMTSDRVDASALRAPE